MFEALEVTAGNLFPRGFGTPFRCDYDGVYYIVNDIFDLLKYIKSNNARSCYMTVYAFRQYDQTIRDKSTAIIDTIPFDFDDKEHPENALADLNKLLGWCRRHNITPRTNYSGSKGFHAFIDIQPVTLKHPAETIKMFVEDMQSMANFKTIDMVVPGDLDRIIRIPNTKHGTTGRYCIPIDPVVIGFLSMDDIIAQSAAPSKYVPRRVTAPNEIIDQLQAYDAYIDEQIKIEAEQRSKLASSKFASVLAMGGTCPAYDDLLVSGTREGNRDHAVCGIIHYCKKHNMDEAQIRTTLEGFAKKCTPNIESSYLEGKLRYHMKADYTYCYFLNSVSDKCSTCKHNRKKR